MSQQPSLTPAEIAKLLNITGTRLKSRHSQFLQVKRNLEKQAGHSLSDSQVRYVMKRMDKEQLAAYGLLQRPAPELGASHITAQRLFFVHPRLHLLESYTKTEFWYPGEIKKAECKHPSRGLITRHTNGEISPVFGCSCGIWVCNSRAALAKAFPRVWPKNLRRLVVSAQVDVWGKCIEHEWGWRAQYARINASTIQIYPRVNGRRVSHERFIGHLRRKYGA